jgi:hypothetical protein
MPVQISACFVVLGSKVSGSHGLGFGCGTLGGSSEWEGL